MQLRPGETITDEARFIQANASRSEHCKGRAREAYQHNLDTYYQLKKKQENEKPEPQDNCGALPKQ